ncbi:hypothetical protein KFL_000390070 [Klebsormidium nitens]|uniref:Uncharacterized protein n=1 Tax=Klebsormidium nitens TaxID=105231 RepID=A0A1Y1HRM7_KLENI|nr:hypothetical protein KFL_000390070 [Klebsormidium nitens]|eukprot:GAQ79819.1 hypothetical protein KFL_000390070 [Klebsormidium nitens]
MATLKLSTWLVFIACSTILGAQGASEPFLCLPEPTLVNEFLLANCSNWTNPVLGKQNPRQNGVAPLQVIKCASLTPPGGLSYYLYQVQPPSYACERPPPRVFSTHHQEYEVWGHPVTTSLLAFFCLTMFSSFLVVVGLAIPYIIYFVVHDTVNEARHVELQPVSKEPAGACSAGDSSALETGGERDLCGDEHVKPTPLRKILLLGFAATLVPAILAARFTRPARECFTSRTWTALDGPVGLPDPSEGLNQFLQSANMGLDVGQNVGLQSVSLKPCQTATLNFYVGQLDTSCAQLGDPYGGRWPIEYEREGDIELPTLALPHAMVPLLSFMSYLSWLLFLLISYAPQFGQGASEGCLAVPEPSLNAFLLANASNWTNPVLGEQTPGQTGPAPLQVIKCASLTPPGGLSYDFYQIQPPTQACERPPPRVFSTHHQEYKVWGHPVTTFLVAFVSLTVFITFLVLLGFGIPYSIIRLVQDVKKASEGHVELQAVSTSSSEAPCNASIGSETVDPATDWKKVVWDALRDERGNPTMLSKRILLAFAVAFIPAVLAGLATPRASKCFTSRTWRGLDGPVGLPDPSEGLNQFLTTANGGPRNLTLKVCQTDTLNFYVGQLNTSRAQLGNPYAGRWPMDSERERKIESFFCSYVKLSCAGPIVIFLYLLAFPAKVGQLLTRTRATGA